MWLHNPIKRVAPYEIAGTQATLRLLCVFFMSNMLAMVQNHFQHILTHQQYLWYFIFVAL